MCVCVCNCLKIFILDAYTFCRRAVHEYHHHHNMAAQYSSLLLPPPTSRLAPPPPPPPPPSSHPHPHQYHGKAGMEPWPNSAHHPALDTGTSYSSYPTVPGNNIL